ncbi:MAG TPA: hypothetical protein VLS45_03015 [Methylomicrobium sp.]|nr:hypothetical protein [Methylomicrobium sp.]
MATRKISTASTALANEVSGDAIVIQYDGEEYRLRRRFKRLKFMGLLSSDPVAALRLVFEEGELERLEEVDMDENGMMELIETISTALAGGPKN